MPAARAEVPERDAGVPPAVSVRLLGSVAVAVDGRTIALTGKQGAVLAILALEAGRVVSADRIVDGVWGENSPRTVRAGLQVHISQLRKQLAGLGAPDAIVTRSPGYVLDVDPTSVDIHRFADLAVAARRCLASGDAVGAADRAHRALTTWSGDPLSAIADPPFAGPVATRWWDQRLDVLELWADAKIASDHSNDVIGPLEEAITRFPYRESLWQRLILALYRRGRQVDALGRLAALRRMLSDELGVRPNSAIAELESAILEHEPSLDEGALGALPAPPALSGPGRRLPAAKELFGRDDESQTVAGLVRERRLVTLVGPGGVGKTSLAVDVATTIADEFAQGAWFIDLSSVRDPILVPTAIGAALGLRSNDGKLTIDGVTAVILDASVLLVIDNCEHLIESVAAAVDTIVDRCPLVHVIATSRERLAVPAETLSDVAPLGSTDAVALLTQRAGRVGAHVTGDDSGALERLCRAVDGLPLGVELVAARMQTLSADDIATQLGSAGMLQLQARGSNARHRSLAAAIRWSYDLLTTPAQCLLRRLAVFEGGATLDAVLAVCSDPDGTIQGDSVSLALDLLVSTSLTHVDRGRPASRYRLLDTVRAFALDQFDIDERELTCRRHADEVIALGHRLRAFHDGPDPAPGFDLIAAEVANVRGAARFCIESGDALRLARIIGAPGPFMLREAGAVAELDSFIDHALAAPQLVPLDRLGVLLVATFRSSRPAVDAVALAQEARLLADQLGDEAALATADFMIGDVELDTSTDQTTALLRSAVERAERIGQFQIAGQAINTLANLLLRGRQFDAALDLLEPRIATAGRYAVTEPYIRYQHARTLLMMGDLDGARSGFEQTMIVASTMGVTQTIGYAEFGLAMLAEREQDFDRARHLYERSLVLDLRAGDWREALNTRMKLLECCVQLDDLTTAREYHVAIARLAAAHRGPREVGFEALGDALIALAEDRPLHARARLIEAVDAFAPTEMRHSMLDVLAALGRTLPQPVPAWLTDAVGDYEHRGCSGIDLVARIRTKL